MKGYGQFCPVAKACEVVTERWTPLILRELLLGSRRFNELVQGVPQMSRTLLSQRLQGLEDAGVIRSVPRADGAGKEYQLTQAGRELRPIILQLGYWGQRWARRRLRPEDHDVALLMWDMRRRIERDALPEARVVVRFEFSGVPRAQAARRTWWLVLERSGAGVCLRDPGHPVDLVVRADLPATIDVWTGQTSFAEARRRGLWTVEGPRAMAQELPRWLKLSVLADWRSVRQPA